MFNGTSTLKRSYTAENGVNLNVGLDGILTESECPPTRCFEAPEQGIFLVCESSQGTQYLIHVYFKTSATIQRLHCYSRIFEQTTLACAGADVRTYMGSNLAPLCFRIHSGGTETV